MGRKLKYGEPTKPITSRIPLSIVEKMGDEPGDQIAEIVIKHYKRKKGKSKNELPALRQTN